MKKTYFSPEMFIGIVDNTDAIMSSGQSRQTDYVNMNAEFGGND